MSERPTPITDANRKRICGNWDHQGDHVREFVPAEVCANLERQLAEAREEIGRIRKFATVNGVAELERQLADAKAELNEWKTLQGWGGTPEIINAFIKGQQSRIRAAQDIEEQLAEAIAQLRIADEQLALERGALAEAWEQRNRLADAFSEWPRLREWLEMEPFIKGYLSVEIPTLDAMSAALAALKEATQEQS